MSRVGKAPIAVPSGVNIDISKGNLVTVKGPKGTLTQQVDMDINIALEDGQLNVTRPTDQKRHRALHGLYRSLLANMVKGVHEGYISTLELVGVGYKVEAKDSNVLFTLGYSHPIEMSFPSEIKVEAKMEKGSPPTLILKCHEEQCVLKSVHFVKLNHTKVKVFVSKVKKYAVKLVKQLVARNKILVNLSSILRGYNLVIKFYFRISFRESKLFLIY
jgi:large subunit ribosomal protein L6